MSERQRKYDEGAGGNFNKQVPAVGQGAAADIRDFVFQKKELGALNADMALAHTIIHGILYVHEKQRVYPDAPPDLARP